MKARIEWKPADGWAGRAWRWLTLPWRFYLAFRIVRLQRRLEDMKRETWALRGKCRKALKP